MSKYPGLKDPKQEIALRFNRRENELRQRKDPLFENPRYPIEILDEVVAEMLADRPVPPAETMSPHELESTRVGILCYEAERKLKESTEKLAKLKRESGKAEDIAGLEAVIEVQRRQATELRTKLNKLNEQDEKK